MNRKRREETFGKRQMVRFFSLVLDSLWLMPFEVMVALKKLRQVKGNLLQECQS